MQPIINTMLDPIVNFGKVTVSTGYDNAATSIILTTGHGSKLPNPSTDGSFNLVWYDSSSYASASDDPNVEIVRCILRTGDTLVVMRAQEGTSASNKNTPTKTYNMILSPTKKTITDIKAEYQSLVSTHSALTTGIHGISISGFEDKANKNVANGYAGLNATTKIDEIYLPNRFKYFLGSIAFSEMTIVAGWWGQINNNPNYDYDVDFVSERGYRQSNFNGDEIKLSNLTLNAGTYEITVALSKSNGTGILEVLHGTTSLGTYDTYNPGGWVSNVVATFTYNLVARTTADLRFRCSGKNPSSPDYRLYISRLQILKTH